MEPNRQRNGLINTAVALCATIVLYVIARYTGSRSAEAAAFFTGPAMLVCAVSWFQMRIEQQERLERLELDEIAKGPRGALFEAQGGDVPQARRVREQFEKIFGPLVAVLLLIFEGIGAWWMWRRVVTALPANLREPVLGLAVLGIVALVLFLLGKYSAGVARLERHRLLRPQAGYLLLGAFVVAVVVLALIAVEAGVPRVDHYVARGLAVVLGALAAEGGVRLVLEIYRPRIEGKAVAPLYESRAVGLLSHPEGLVASAAQALDYQFGFKVSETWFYQSLKRAGRALFLAQLTLLLLSTCFVFVNGGEQALLERAGQFHRLLNAGPHLKLPWPIERVYRYPTEQIQRFDIGFVHGDHDSAGQKNGAVLWTVSHYKEEFNLLVANREITTTTNAEPSGKGPPVSLLSVSIPVQYQIKSLTAWAYTNREPERLLQSIGTREVVRYLVSADLHEVMSSGRFAAGEELRKRIQARTDELDLGVNILFVGLQDVHPPIKVASAYEAVVVAEHKKRAAVLAAEAYRVQTNALSAAAATTRRTAAEGQRVRLEADARARAALFTNQVAAYRAAPDVYTLRSYLQTLQRAGATARKYVLVSTNADNVIFLNLEDKIYSADPLNIMRGASQR